MGEYEAFPYQNHKAPVHTRVFHVEAKKALTFDELYSPRGEGGAPVNIGTSEKSYWRTRDRISFTFWECRKQKVMIITCKDVSSAAGEAFKTIVVNLETLYREIDQRKRAVDPPEELLFKANKGLQTDAELHKAAIEHLLNRLNIVEEPQPWPSFDEVAWLAQRAAAARPPPEDPEAGEEAEGEEEDPAPKKPVPALEAAAVAAEAVPGAAGEAVLEAAPAGPYERMATLTLLSADTITLEMPVEALRVLKVDLAGIDATQLKLLSTAAVAEAEAAAAAAAASPRTTQEPVVSVNTAATPTKSGGDSAATKTPDTKDKPTADKAAVSPAAGGGAAAVKELRAAGKAAAVAGGGKAAAAAAAAKAKGKKV